MVLASRVDHPAILQVRSRNDNLTYEEGISMHLIFLRIPLAIAVASVCRRLVALPQPLWSGL